MNQFLMSDFTEVKVKEALLTMNPSGVPRPNGFLAYFYQKNWHAVEKEISKFVLSFVKKKKKRDNIESINHTFITFIPKVKFFCKVGDFRPISLCNVF